MFSWEHEIPKMIHFLAYEIASMYLSFVSDAGVSSDARQALCSSTKCFEFGQFRRFLNSSDGKNDTFNASVIAEGSASSRLSTGGVLPSSGPLGPSPNQTYWPEPPPPYSPYTVGPPQWPSMNHQPPAGLLAPPVATLFGQSPTATAVTRTDFYQAPFNGVCFTRAF